MTPQSHLTRSQLQAFLGEYGAVPHEWMFTYLSRDQLLRIYHVVQNAPEGKKIKISSNDEAKLEAKRMAHREQVRNVRRDRKELYGTSVKTSKEVLKHLFRTRSDMQFLEARSYDAPFVSAAGTARSKNALVFQDAEGELLFTLAEVKVLHAMGLSVPAAALREPRSPGKTAKRGLGGLIG